MAVRTDFKEQTVSGAKGKSSDFLHKALAEAKLYLVLDTAVASPAKLFEILGKAVSGGAQVVQLRAKGLSDRVILDYCRRIKQILRGRVPFILNDRPDLALAAKADGVHLGQEDLPVLFARKLLGNKALIGVSCQGLEHARRAERQGADYVGLGSVFPTLTKPGRKPLPAENIRKVFSLIKIPVFAIGGIDEPKAVELRFLGVKRIAVTRAVCLAADPLSSARNFRKVLDKADLS